MFRLWIAAASLVLSLQASFAEEGLWTFDRFPTAAVTRSYDFVAGPDFLANLRLGSVSVGECSGAFVSPHGLVISNRHCVTECLTQLSTPGHNLTLSGFYAEMRPDEIQCPGMVAKQLITIVPVTDRVREAMAGLNGTALADARRAILAKLADDCPAGEDTTCEVVTLYRGGQYDLYKYRRFTDIRMAFAPELSIGFFGGDPDNFEFPRYDLDVSFLRIYVHGQPLEASNYFPFSATDVKDGQLVFSVGNPQNSIRELTVAQLEDVRDFNLPRWLVFEAEERGILTEFQRRGADARRVSGAAYYSIMNSLKDDRGRYDALIRSTIMKTKREAEALLRSRIDSDPVLRERYGSSWDTVAKLVAKYRADIGDRYEMLEASWGMSALGGYGYGFFSPPFQMAKTLVRLTEESTKPSGQRLHEFIDAELASQRAWILSWTSRSDDLEIVQLTRSLSLIREYLGPDDEDTQAIFGSSSPEELATSLIMGTKLKDVAVRERLLSGGKSAIDASDDPLIAFVRRIDPRLRAIRRLFEEQIWEPMNRATTLIADAKVLVEGTANYPDATGTPRISYGQVKGFVNGGRVVPATTSVAGLFARAAAHRGTSVPALLDSTEPFRLPPSWITAQDALAPSMVLDFATTQDTLSGNSGSPVIDINGRLVGVLFDGNFQSIGGIYGFDPALNRSVAVSSGVILQALAKIYHATRLAKEISDGMLH